MEESCGSSPKPVTHEPLGSWEETIKLPAKRRTCACAFQMRSLAIQETVPQNLKPAKKRRQRSFIYNRLQEIKIPNWSCA